MTVTTRADLKSRSIVVRDETTPGANTANRVGGLSEDFVDSVFLITGEDAVFPTDTGFANTGILVEDLSSNDLFRVTGEGSVVAKADVPITETGTTRTLALTDYGKIIRYTNAAGCTVTVPDTLPVGFNCLHIQRGTAQIIFVAGGSIVIDNPDNHIKSAKIKAVVATFIEIAGVCNLNGYTGL
jgi:hypothetical protein